MHSSLALRGGQWPLYPMPDSLNCQEVNGWCSEIFGVFFGIGYVSLPLEHMAGLKSNWLKCWNCALQLSTGGFRRTRARDLKAQSCASPGVHFDFSGVRTPVSIRPALPSRGSLSDRGSHFPQDRMTAVFRKQGHSRLLRRQHVDSTFAQAGTGRCCDQFLEGQERHLFRALCSRRLDVSREGKTDNKGALCLHLRLKDRKQASLSFKTQTFLKLATKNQTKQRRESLRLMTQARKRGEQRPVQEEEQVEDHLTVPARSILRNSIGTCSGRWTTTKELWAGEGKPLSRHERCDRHCSRRTHAQHLATTCMIIPL